MKKVFIPVFILAILFYGLNCSCADKTPLPGAYQTELYKNLLKGKSVAVVANQTSMIGHTHLVDSLLSLKVNIKLIFSPEHGFRDLADAGETIENGKDPATGIQL
jgi:uncharacterized protein YbbC (DUF1343 family)